MIKQLLYVLLSSFCFGWIAIELAAMIAKIDFFVSRGIVVGFAYAITWVLVYWLNHQSINKFGWCFAVSLGIAIPFMACLFSIVGIGFISRVIYFWYVLLPMGGINGFVVHLINKKSTVIVRIAK